MQLASRHSRRPDGKNTESGYLLGRGGDEDVDQQGDDLELPVLDRMMSCCLLWGWPLRKGKRQAIGGKTRWRTTRAGGLLVGAPCGWCREPLVNGSETVIDPESTWSGLQTDSKKQKKSPRGGGGQQPACARCWMLGQSKQVEVGESHREMEERWRHATHDGDGMGLMMKWKRGAGKTRAALNPFGLNCSGNPGPPRGTRVLPRKGEAGAFTLVG